MDHNIEEYLASNGLGKEHLSDKEFIDFHYERTISKYRSSTVMVYESWRDTFIVSGEEIHHDEFI